MSALEMKDTMYKLLPGVLLNLSKISATVSIAPNILEFLSTLNRLPDVYSSFVEEQYLSIFAITLPFINPFKVTISLPVSSACPIMMMMMMIHSFIHSFSCV